MTVDKGGLAQRGLVSAAHVLSVINKARLDDDIIRPGYPDGPKSKTNRIGSLKDFIYLVHYDDEVGAAISSNEDDVAFVSLDEGIPTDDVNLVPDPATPDRLVKLRGVATAEELLGYRGIKAFKFGRTSKFTEGVVSGFSELPIELPDRRTYLYTQVVQVESTTTTPFSAPGDSARRFTTMTSRRLAL